ncbi:MAG: ferredoxin [Puniceicoccales bacterium]
MKFIPIAHKKSECIGCALCTEVAPEYWYLDENGEAQLREVKRTDKQFEYGEGLPQDRKELQTAAKGCPVNIIRVD